MFHFGAHLYKIKSINTIDHESNFGWHITWDQAQCNFVFLKATWYTKPKFPMKLWDQMNI